MPIMSLEGKKVMWVEDDKFLSDVIAKKLSSEKAHLVHTAVGEEAFPLAEKELPDIILLDILLPGLDGFEILRLLKKSDRTRSIPVILFSNLGQKSDIDKGKDLGAVKFLVKATVTLDEIVSEIKSTLP
jgi:CheY-like chemotaxis protein